MHAAFQRHLAASQTRTTALHQHKHVKCYKHHMSSRLTLVKLEGEDGESDSVRRAEVGAIISGNFGRRSWLSWNLSLVTWACPSRADLSHLPPAAEHTSLSLPNPLNSKTPRFVLQTQMSSSFPPLSPQLASNLSCKRQLQKHQHSVIQTISVPA